MPGRKGHYTTGKLAWLQRLGTEKPETIGTMVKCWLVDDMVEESAIAAVLEGNESQQKVWTACGATLPNRAAPGTIRAFVPVNGGANDQRKRVFKLIHAAGPAESRWEQSAAAHEIGLIFPDLG